jgi:glycosyltransferase involved in cell wall biosynthesis
MINSRSQTMPYRIMILETELEMGGKEKKLFDFIRRTDRSRFRIAVCCLMRGGYFKSKLQGLGVPFYDNLLRHPYDALAFRALRAVLKSEETQIIYTFAHPSTVIFAYLARLSGLIDRFIVSFHATGREEGGRMIPAYLRPLLRRADLLLAVAEMHKDHLVRAEGLPADKIRVIHNGVDTVAYHPAGPEERERTRVALRIPSDAVVIISVASLKPAKNIDVLLRAAAELLRASASTRLLLVGNGPDRDALESMAEALGIRDRVVFAGLRDDIPAMLHAADVLVLPSKWGTETFPNVVLEAMASGLPVVSSDVGSVREMVEEGRSALIVPPDDERSLKVALERVAGDSALRRSMGARGREIAEQRFRIEAMCRKREAVFEELMKPRAADAPAPVGPDR